MLASAVFKRALKKKGFAESQPSEIDGLYHVEACDWDAEAFLIVLRIIHHRNRQVDRKISLEMLAKIAVLVDYYEFGEELDMFKKLWIEELQKPDMFMPTTYSRDLILWVWVAYVFGLEELFSEGMVVTIMQSTGPMRTLGLPIPAGVSGKFSAKASEQSILTRIIDMIDLKRDQSIEWVIDTLHTRLEQYGSFEYVCSADLQQSFECGCFLLGALRKQMDRLGLLAPQPRKPFPHLSFQEVCNKVSTIRSPSWYASRNRNRHPCDLNVKTIIEGALPAVFELTLGIFDALKMNSR
jgi:hypothetical protein